MGSGGPAPGEGDRRRAPTSVRRALRIAVALASLALAGLAAAAWIAGDRSQLEIDYEGFD